MSEIILLEPPYVFWCHQNDQERHSRFCSTRLFAFQFKYLSGVPRDVLSCFLFLFAVEAVVIVVAVVDVVGVIVVSVAVVVLVDVVVVGEVVVSLREPSLSE